MSEILTPQQIRERLVKSYTATFAASGVAVDQQAIERMVLADLEMVDAARARGEIDGGGKRDPRPSSPRPTPFFRDPTSKGARALGPDRGGAQPYRPSVLHQNPQQLSARWGYACGRIARITEGSVPVLVAGQVDLRATCATAAHPALALRYMEQWSFYVTHGQPAPPSGTDHNPFRGLSDRDASRAFMRAVEDICDASTGVLGSWFVK